MQALQSQVSHLEERQRTFDELEATVRDLQQHLGRSRTSGERSVAASEASALDSSTLALAATARADNAVDEKTISAMISDEVVTLLKSQYNIRSE